MRRKKIWLPVMAAALAAVCIAGGITAIWFMNDRRQNEKEFYAELERIDTAASADVFDEDGFNELLSRSLCTGSWGKTEQAVKAYVRDVYACFRDMARNTADYDLPYLLSSTNIKEDGPDFAASLQTIKEAKSAAAGDLARAKELLQGETCRRYIAEKGVGEDYETAYDNAFAQKVEAESGTVLAEMQAMYDAAAQSCDGCTEVLSYLRSHPGSWYVEDDTLLFTSETAAEEFRALQRFTGAGENGG